ncbi:MAG: DUF2848 domain-containing protein [Roseiarcus sp.]
MAAHVKLELDFIEKTRTTHRAVIISKAVVGGWTGRDKAALRHHIEELAKIGVKPPETTPLFYRVGVSRLVQAEDVEVIGEGSSGEVEYVMLKIDGRIWIGAGSDHTDRAVEHMGITIAKQLCDKPVARAVWPLDEVEEHWDRLILRSHIEEGGERKLYQEGGVASLLSPRELLARYEEGAGDLEEGALMFGGTCGAIGGVRYSKRFSFELADPVLHRKIQHSYGVHPVPIRG